MKQESLEFMMRAVREVLEGRIFVSPVLNNRILSGFARHVDGEGDAITGRLSDRELEVFGHIGNGKSVRDIAGDLNISVKTVETHRSHIKEKLDMGSARELSQLARGWVESESNSQSAPA